MTVDQQVKSVKTLDRSTATRGTGTDSHLPEKSREEAFPGAFAKLKLSVIRPAFDLLLFRAIHV